jgi:diguanylate cyclase (GGDEF)-like protein
MNKSKDVLEIIAIGLDYVSTEGIKKLLRDNKTKYRIIFIKNVDEIPVINKQNPQAVFFYSNRQSQKTIEEIRKIHHFIPGAGVILISPRSDHHGIVNAFRAGIFDFLTLPMDQDEFRTVIYRLKIHGALQTSQMTPERAVLQLFSRPESYFSILDVASAFNQYLSTFFVIEKEIVFLAGAQNLKILQDRLKLSDHHLARIHRFLNDETGLIFGISYVRNRFYFLLKRGDSTVAYLVAKNTSSFLIKDILSTYLSNILKTTLSILIESKRKEEIRILSLTDEVTGLFNQRKLHEDLNHYIGRYQHERIGFCLLFIDIDYFKNVNDQFGHVVGSQILIDMSSILRTELRSNDLVYRYGGDEFIVLLPKTDIDDSKKIALRISEAVKSAEFSINETQKYRLSLSIGVSQFPSDAANAKSIIDFADKMMYQSKKSGRGKVFHVTEVI